MDRETLDNFIENYDSHDEILISKMALLIEKYPYFQLPRFLYTKSLKDQNKNDLEVALNQLALYTADRGILKYSIESKLHNQKKIEAGIKDVEIHIDDYGLIPFQYLPTELTFFADAGVAWTEAEESINLRPSAFEFRVDRPAVTSVGISGRFNLFGYLIMEVYYAHPFQRPERGAHVGVQLVPGW